MRVLALFTPGPNWLAGAPVGRQDRTVVRSHLLNMRRLYDAGSLIFGGPTANGFGGMALVEAETLVDAQRLMEDDPAVRAGLMTVQLTAVSPYFDAFAGRVWSSASASPAHE